VDRHRVAIIGCGNIAANHARAWQSVPERAGVGLDREHDLARGFTVTDSGITVVPKGTVIEP